MSSSRRRRYRLSELLEGAEELKELLREMSELLYGDPVGNEIC